MGNDTIRLLIAVIFGGIFGWTLGRLPDKWVYAIMGLGAVLVLILITRGA